MPTEAKVDLQIDTSKAKQQAKQLERDLAQGTAKTMRAQLQDLLNEAQAASKQMAAMRKRKDDPQSAVERFILGAKKEDIIKAARRVGREIYRAEDIHKISEKMTADAARQQRAERKLGLQQISAKEFDVKKTRTLGLQQISAKAEDQKKTRKLGLDQLTAQAEDQKKTRKLGLEQISAKKEDDKKIRKLGLDQLTAQAEEQKRKKKVQTDERKMTLAHMQALAEDRKRSGQKDGNDARNAARRAKAMRQDEMRETMRDMVMFHSAVSAITGPFPGGGIAQAGAYGMTSGFRRGKLYRDPETGEMRERKGLSGFAHGMWGGMKGLAAGAGIAGLAAGVVGSAVGLRENEDWFRVLARASGGQLGTARGALGQAKSVGLTSDETVPIAAQMLKNTRGLGGVDSAMRAQVLAGAGGEMAGLAGALSQGGAFSGGGKHTIDANLKKVWQDIFAAGVAQGFKGGNVPEMLAGAMSVANQRVLGVALNQSAGSDIAKMAASLFRASGGSSVFQGQSGFNMMQIANNMISGQGSAFAKGMALYPGLAQGNTFMESAADASAGLFGSRYTERRGGRVTTPAERLRGMLMQYRGQMGLGGGSLNRDQTSDLALMLHAAGVAPNEAAAMEYAGLDPNKITDRALADIKEGTKGDAEKRKDLEEKAFKAMASLGSMKGLDKALEDLRTALGMLLNDTGGIKALTQAVRGLTDGINWVRKRFGDGSDAEKAAGASTLGARDALERVGIDPEANPEVAKEFVARRQRMLDRGKMVFTEAEYNKFRARGWSEDQIYEGTSLWAGGVSEKKLAEDVRGDVTGNAKFRSGRKTTQQTVSTPGGKTFNVAITEVGPDANSSTNTAQRKGSQPPIPGVAK